MSPRILEHREHGGSIVQVRDHDSILWVWYRRDHSRGTTSPDRYRTEEFLLSEWLYLVHTEKVFSVLLPRTGFPLVGLVLVPPQGFRRPLLVLWVLRPLLLPHGTSVWYRVDVNQGWLSEGVVFFSLVQVTRVVAVQYILSWVFLVPLPPKYPKTKRSSTSHGVTYDNQVD